MVPAIRRGVLAAVLVVCSVLSVRTQSLSPLTANERSLHLFGPVPSGIGPLEEHLPPAGDGVAGRKSVALAAIYSLLLPGMGEVYGGTFSAGKYFLMAEAGLWLTYAAFELYGNDLRDNSRAYAVAHAGVSLAGKEDQYFIDIGNFIDIQEYNDKQLRDRQPGDLYGDPSFVWRWESDAARLTYRDQRINSETMYNNRKFVVAAIIVNHVLSAINAARGVAALNASLAEQRGALSFDATVLGGPGNAHGIMVSVHRAL